MQFQPGDALSPRQAMEFSIFLAKKALGKTAPNPMVGCVILNSNSKLVSYGYHQTYGKFHAEKNALEGVQKEQVKEGSIFVSLEPCDHYGKTPPCSDLVASYPFSTLYYGSADPNPKVSGRGLEKLRKKGISVRKYDKDLWYELVDLNEIFFYHIKYNTAFVALKVATDLEGAMAYDDGKSKKITGIKSHEYVHFLRQQYSAVAIGKSTLHLDNPKLNIRYGEVKKNKVLIFDSKGECLDKIESFNIFSCRDPEDIIIVGDQFPKNLVSSNDLWIHKKGVCLINYNRENPEELLDKLFKMGIYSLFVEGGAKLYAYFLKHSLLQRLYWFQSNIKILSDKKLHWLQYSELSINDIERMMVKSSELSFDSDRLLNYGFTSL